MDRNRIKEIVALMQEKDSDVNALSKELLEIKKALGDAVPNVDHAKLNEKYELVRTGEEIKTKKKSSKKKK